MDFIVNPKVVDFLKDFDQYKTSEFISDIIYAYNSNSIYVDSSANKELRIFKTNNGCIYIGLHNANITALLFVTIERNKLTVNHLIKMISYRLV